MKTAIRTTTRGIALTALALLMAACEDVPTFPEPASGSDEAAQSAALDHAAASVQAAIEDQLALAVADTAAPKRDTTHGPGRDTTGTRPNRPTRPDPTQPRRGRVELAVQLGAEAVELAERLLANGADPDQKRFLEQAQELQRKAEAALKEGRDDSAIQLAEAASQMALKAVVLPGGITKDEARMIHDVAADLLAQAKAAVQRDPTDLKRQLLGVAEQLFREGTEQLGNGQGQERGVASLWKSAVLSSWLVG